MHRRFLPCLVTAIVLGWIALAPLATPASAQAEVGGLFAGEWNMQGRFRYSPEADWIPTGSTLVGRSALNGTVALRDIVAPQIGFEAVDLITFNPETGVAQYIYMTSEAPTALFFEGMCTTEDCRSIEFVQLCGPSWGDAPCTSRSTITFETDDRFVARDYYPGPSGELFMGREVFYSRAGSSP